MSGRVYNLSKPFRKKFEITNQQALQWFPGHMYRSMERMQAVLKDIDCVVEVHDARIPFSGRNPRFRDFLHLRPHILILNKVDLVDIDKGRELVINDKLKSHGIDTVYYTDIRNYEQNTLLKQEILPKAIELTNTRPRYARTGLLEYNIMVIGVPNVGKSTFINAVRWSHIKKKGRATKVGAIAGVTRQLMNKIQVSTNPVTFVFDTPGILTPTVPSVEVGMKLALCRCIPNQLIGEDNIADYLLFWLNKHQRFEYVEKYGLKNPTDNIYEMLESVAIKNNQVRKIRDVNTNQYKYVPNFVTAATIVLKDFAYGDLGLYFLDTKEIE